MSDDPISDLIAAAANVLQVTELHGESGIPLDLAKLRASGCYRDLLRLVKDYQTALAKGEARIPEFKVEGGKPC